MRRRTLQIFGGMIGAISASQFPVFFKAYLSEIETRYSETVDGIENMIEYGKKNNVDFCEKIERLQSAGEIGKAAFLDYSNACEKIKVYQDAYNSLKNSAILQKPFTLFENWNEKIGQNIIDNYEFSISTGSETIIFALSGFVIAYLIIYGLMSMLRQLTRAMLSAYSFARKAPP